MTFDLDTGLVHLDTVEVKIGGQGQSSC